ncbi:MAG: hypothetical protein QXR26_03145 [Candidatus Caldarchaeum sp.]
MSRDEALRPSPPGVRGCENIESSPRTRIGKLRQKQTLTQPAVEGGHPFLNAVGWRGRVWLETGPWRGHWVGGRAVGRQTTYEGCLDNAGRRSPHPFHLCFSDTMGVFERVCGWMLETRRRRITFRGFRRYTLTHGLVAWLEGVFHGLTGRPPQPLHGEGYEPLLPSQATGLTGG